MICLTTLYACFIIIRNKSNTLKDMLIYFEVEISAVFERLCSYHTGYLPK